MSGTLHRITSEDEFDELLATSTKPVLVDVSATWCAPCQRLTPILEEFAASQEGVDVVTVDADDPRALSWRLGGGSIPRMLLFDRGVLQMQVAGVRELPWLDDVVSGYAALGINEPDGLRPAPRTPARRVTLPEPSAGHAGLMVVNGHDNHFSNDTVAPATVDISAGSITVLAVSTEAIDAGYLRQLDPSSIDQVRVGGMLTAQHLEELAHLSSLRSIQGSSVSPERVMELVQQQQQVGRAQLLRLFEAESRLSVDDLAPLAALPLLRRLDIMGGPSGEGVLPHLVGGWWLAPGVAAARADRGLPQHHEDEERSDDPVEPGGLLARRDDGLLDLTVHLTIDDGWYSYPPGSAEGVPVSVRVLTDHTVVEPLTSESGDPRLTGRAKLAAVLDGDDEVRLDVTVQACDGEVCLAPQTTHLVVPLTRMS